MCGQLVLGEDEELARGDAFNELSTGTGLFATFYDRIRPAIVRANDLEVLCDGLSALEGWFHWSLFRANRVENHAGAIQDLSRMEPDAGEPLAVRCLLCLLVVC